MTATDADRACILVPTADGDVAVPVWEATLTGGQGIHSIRWEDERGERAEPISLTLYELALALVSQRNVVGALARLRELFPTHTFQDCPDLDEVYVRFGENRGTFKRIFLRAAYGDWSPDPDDEQLRVTMGYVKWEGKASLSEVAP